MKRVDPLPFSVPILTCSLSLLLFQPSLAGFSATTAGSSTSTKDASVMTPSSSDRSLKEYGAVGSGKEDDSAAFNKAVSQTPDGGTLLIPPGRYLLRQSVDMSKEIDLQFQKGAVLALPKGVTLSLKGDVGAGRWQVFDGDGTVSFDGNVKLDAIYPEWWGARADNSTDNAKPLQAALKAAVTLKGTLSLSRGVYLTGTGLTGGSDLTLRGAGLGKTVIRRRENSRVLRLLEFTNAHGVTIQDLTLHGNNDENKAPMEYGLSFQTSTGITVEHVEVTQTFGAVGATAVAMAFGGVCGRVEVTHCYVHDCGIGGVTPSDGIYYGGSDARITENQIENITDTAIVYEAKSTNVERQTDNVAIANNIIKLQSGNGICVDARVSPSGLTHGAAVTVTGNIIEGAKGASIGGGIQVFGEGGSTQRQVTVSGNVVRNTTGGHGMVIREARDVTVTGNILDNISPKLSMHGIVVDRSQNIILMGNLISRAGGNGISLQGVTDTLLANNLIRENGQGGNASAAGIDIRDGAGGVASSRIILSGNNVSGSPQKYGLLIAGATNDLSIIGNTLQNNVTQNFLNSSRGRVEVLAAPDTSKK